MWPASSAGNQSNVGGSDLQMSQTATRNKEVFALFEAGWTAAGRTEPVEFPNMDFERPDSGGWARITIQDLDSSEMAIGGQWKRSECLVVVQIFVPEKSGDALKSAMADAVTSALERKNVSEEGQHHIVFRRSSTNDVGTQQGSAEYQVNVSIPFRFDRKTTTGG